MPNSWNGEACTESCMRHSGSKQDVSESPAGLNMSELVAAAEPSYTKNWQSY